MVGKAKPSPAVVVAKNVNGRSSILEVTLSTGDRAILKPVTASLIDSVTSRIEEPSVPMWHNPDKDIDEPNPSHPDYLKAKDDSGRKRGIAALDAMVMFGVDLVDGLPENDRWLKKLRFMEKHGQISLEGYDLEDELDKEFLYLRYVAVDNDVITKISELSGISSVEVTEAEDSFPG
jgi:hypothetical protein